MKLGRGDGRWKETTCVTRGRGLNTGPVNVIKGTWLVGENLSPRFWLGLDWASLGIAVQVDEIILDQWPKLRKSLVYLSLSLIELQCAMSAHSTSIFFCYFKYSLFYNIFLQPSKLTLHEKFFTHPPLLPGEQIVSQQDQVTCVDTFNDVAEGILHITTYRIIFAGCYAQVLKYSHIV